MVVAMYCSSFIGSFGIDPFAIYLVNLFTVRPKFNQSAYCKDTVFRRERNTILLNR